ncbi:MAG: zf-HC2 domain-containing protein [Acidobacteriota bacterium]
MECEIKPYLIDYIYDELPEEKKHEFENHLKGCAQCKIDLEEIKDAKNILEQWKAPESEKTFLVPIKQRENIAFFYKSLAYSLAAIIIIVFLSISNFNVSFGKFSLNFGKTKNIVPQVNQEIAQKESEKEFEERSQKAFLELLNRIEKQQKEERLFYINTLNQLLTKFEEKRREDLMNYYNAIMLLESQNRKIFDYIDLVRAELKTY